MRLTTIITILSFILLSSCTGIKSLKFSKKAPPSKTAVVYKKPKRQVTTSNASIIGKLAGSVIANQGGLALDSNDKEYMTSTSQTALENASTGQTMRWKNPDSGNYGSTKVITNATAEGQKVCRKYMQTITVEGKTFQFSAKACRQIGSSWLNS
jgi:surface antigen